MRTQASPVKEIATQFFPRAQLFQPERASDESFLEKLKDLKADLFVVVAFGQILTKKLLGVPPKGCINIHTSLLPKFRGAAPIQRCLLAGEKETGVAIQKMVWELDAGDVIASAKLTVPKEMNCKELEIALCELSQPLLVRVLEEYSHGIPEAKPQDHSLATYASKIVSDDGAINWHESSEVIHNKIRGLFPRPGAWTWLEKDHKKMKVLKAKEEPSIEGTPGEILTNEGIVACGKGSIQILEVQPEGKKAMSWSAWYRGALKQTHFF